MCDQLEVSHCSASDLTMRVYKDTVFVSSHDENSSTNIENLNKCKQWLEKCTITDDTSTCSECLDDSSSSITESSECSSQIVSRSDYLSSLQDNSMGTDQLKSIIQHKPNVYENILINNSKKVHLGNVTVINGPIYLKETKKQDKSHEEQDMPEHLRLAEAHIRWIDRRGWLSQPPAEEYDKMKGPAKFVIICHSATEDATTHADNILLVRLIQQFHIECRQWSDIAYNFLIGSDGYTYKGRGWGMVGAHSFRYNFYSVGICFVGTFSTKLPPQIALEQARTLIKYGVEQGEIVEDYRLIGNCQVSSSKSPGERLYAEIQTWDHYDGSISLENPSPLLEDT